MDNTARLLENSNLLSDTEVRLRFSNAPRGNSTKAISDLREAVLATRQQLESAKIQAEQILAQSTVEAEKFLQAARLEGYSQGCEQAQAKLFDQAQLQRKMIEDAALEMSAQVLAISEEVLGTALELQPQSICDRVARAISLCAANCEISVYVASQDLSYLRRAIERLTKAAPYRPPLQLHEDKTLSAGNARIETSGVVLHSSVKDHLRAIKLHLLASAK